MAQDPEIEHSFRGLLLLSILKETVTTPTNLVSKNLQRMSRVGLESTTYLVDLDTRHDSLLIKDVNNLLAINS